MIMFNEHLFPIRALYFLYFFDGRSLVIPARVLAGLNVAICLCADVACLKSQKTMNFFLFMFAYTQEDEFVVRYL